MLSDTHFRWSPPPRHTSAYWDGKDIEDIEKWFNSGVSEEEKFTFAPQPDGTVNVENEFHYITGTIRAGWINFFGLGFSMGLDGTRRYPDEWLE